MKLHPKKTKWSGLLFDFIAVLVFVAIGRSVHDHGLEATGMTSTTWPFAVGLGVGWWLIHSRRRSGRSLVDGVVVCFVTVALGMALRVVSGQGTQFTFVVVALCFLGLFMLAWRALLIWRHRRAVGPGRSRQWPRGV